MPPPAAPLGKDSPLATLTVRELEVLRWVAQCKTNWEIARIVRCRPGTVKKHLEHIYRKLGVESRMAAASFLLFAGTMPAPT